MDEFNFRMGAVMRRLAKARGLLLLAMTTCLFAAQRPPEPISTPEPVYPPEMFNAGVPGGVLVEFTINSYGAVIEAEATQSSNKAFLEPALTAVRKWKYKPATVNGQTVNVRARQLITFDYIPEPVYPRGMLENDTRGNATVEYFAGKNGRTNRTAVLEETHREYGLALQAMVAEMVLAPIPEGRSPDYKARITRVFDLSGSGAVPVSERTRRLLLLLHADYFKPALESELDHPLVLLAKRPAVFPSGLEEAGTAEVEFFIDEEGLVQLPQIVAASREEFGFSAAQALSHRRYEPPMKAGKPVVVSTRATFAFRPPGRNPP